MTPPSSEPQQIERDIQGLATLREAYIDASSMIICNKAGILDLLSTVCTLRTVHSVMAETGYDDAPVSVEPDPDALAITELSMGVETHAGLSAPDRALLTAAVNSGTPLICDDLLLLKAFSTVGLPWYNSLMMLNLLLLQSSLTAREGEAALRLLLRAARYHPDVVSYARMVGVAITQRG